MNDVHENWHFKNILFFKNDYSTFFAHRGADGKVKWGDRHGMPNVSISVRSTKSTTTIITTNTWTKLNINGEFKLKTLAIAISLDIVVRMVHIFCRFFFFFHTFYLNGHNNNERKKNGEVKKRGKTLIVYRLSRGNIKLKISVLFCRLDRSN